MNIRPTCASICTSLSLIKWYRLYPLRMLVFWTVENNLGWDSRIKQRLMIEYCIEEWSMLQFRLLVWASAIVQWLRSIGGGGWVWGWGWGQARIWKRTNTITKAQGAAKRGRPNHAEIWSLVVGKVFSNEHMLSWVSSSPFPQPNTDFQVSWRIWLGKFYFRISFS